MSNRQFLFVNKDAESSSLTRSSAREQSSINSHVQRGRRHRRSVHSSARRKPQANKESSPAKAEKAEKAESASGSSPTSSTSSSSSIPIRPSGFNTFVLTPDGGHKLLTPGQSDTSHGRERQAEKRYESAASAREWTAQQTSQDLVSFAKSEVGESGTSTPRHDHHFDDSPHDITQIAVNQVDPFSKASVTIDPQVYKLMQYYQLVYHPAVWHAETRTSGKSTYAFQTSASEVLRNAMQSSVDMYALLACMASRMQHVDQRPEQGTDQYLQKALSSTRMLLEQRGPTEVKSNEQILMIIFHLYAAEGYRENMKAAKIHLKAAKTIVDCIGGLNMLRDPQMRELLVIGDGHLSAIALEPCEFPCDFDPGPYHTATIPELQINEYFDLSALAPALRQRRRVGLIPAEICDLVEETAECTWVLQHAKQAPPEPSKHAMRWVTMRQLAIRHRLQALKLGDPRVDAIRVTLMLWILITMTLLGLKRLSLVIAPKLRAILKRANTQSLEWKGHYDLKAWILSLGATTAAVGGSDEKWFVRKFAETAGHSGMPSNSTLNISEVVAFDRLQKLQSQFFYHDAVQRPRLQRLAELLVATSNEMHTDAD